MKKLIREGLLSSKGSNMAFDYKRCMKITTFPIPYIPTKHEVKTQTLVGKVA